MNMIKKYIYRLSSLLLGVTILTSSLTSCQDDEFTYPSGPLSMNAVKATTSSSNASGLVQNTDGTWTATRRVPLVGAGRVLNNISSDLLKVVGWVDDAQKVIDLNLDEGFDTGTSAVEAQLLANQIISVLDMGHEYAANQKVGFVIKDDGNGVLDLDVLKGFWLKLFRDGKQVGYYTFMEATNVADLGIGNITGGSAEKLQVIETTATVSFDEVRLGCGGVAANIANQMIVYYAYVGENPIIPAVNNCPESPISSEYFEDNVGYKTGSPWSSYAGRPSLIKLIDDDLDNGIVIETISSFFQPYMTVDFGREIPAGSEVGFYITNGALLNLSIAGTNEITTYDAQEQIADNYTLTEIIGLQLLGGGQSYLSIKTTKACRFIKIQFLGIDVNLGGTKVHYAFVREKTTVDVSSYFNISDAVVYNPTYRFALPQGLPEGAKVEYTLIDYPDRLSSEPQIKPSDYDGSYYLSGMNVAGDYLVEARLIDNNGKTLATCEATITRAVRDQENCTQPLVNSEGTDIYKAYAWDKFNGIEIGGDIQTGEYSNVVDDNKDNCIEATDISVNVTSDQMIVGVEKIDKTTAINADIHSKERKTRVGFVINKESDFLNLDVLKFLRIKLYRNGEIADVGVADDNHGVSLGLIQAGSSTSKKTCLSIETEYEFDQIELYCSGLLGTNLVGSIRVYYAYIEDAEDECANPGEECMQLITNANYGAVPSIDLAGGASVGTSVNGMANIVDNSIESAGVLVSPADIASVNSIRVTFDPIKANQEVGFILSDITGLAEVNLIDVITITAYRTIGEVKNAVGSTTSGGALSLKIAGKGEYQYISVTPSKEFDELELTISNVVEALGNTKIHGVYLLPDYDNDGVVDCISDEATTMVMGLHPEPTDICEGESTSIRVDGGVENAEYTLTFLTEDPNQNKETPRSTKVTLNSSGRLTFTDPTYIANLPADEYWLSIAANAGGKIEYSGVKFTVHPNETTWTGSEDEQWSNWDNWTRGIPWSCTNVIIPSPENSPTYDGNVSNYPVITAESDAQCYNIHFEPGAELIGQRYLTLSEGGKAFVDMQIIPGKYNLLSAPLQSMFTGDMFVLSDANRENWRTWQQKTITDETNPEKVSHPNYFIPINGGSDVTNAGAYPENRNNPFVYQRLWSSTVTNRAMTRSTDYNTEDPVIINQTDWSRSFNSVATGYERGEGFAVKIGNDANQNENFFMHFPKEYDTYYYYKQDGESTGIFDNISRTSPGKLMQWANTIYLERQDEGNLFLLGNPYMAHINIEKFLKANSETIVRVKVYNKDKGSYEDVTTGQISPMEAVFVETKEIGRACLINFTDEMFEQGKSSQNYSKVPVEQLNLNATVNGYTATCSILPSASASDAYDVQEDATLLVGSEEGSGVAVFTVADNKALSIQSIRSATRIPVGFYLKQEGDVSLTFDASDNTWNGWELKDEQTGRSYPINGRITLNDVSTGSGRFFLEKLQ